MAKDIINAENVIGAQSVFEGKLHLKGNLRIDGIYEGDSLHVDSLFVGKDGKVRTKIRANNVMIEGIVIGSIEAKVRAILYPSAKILGDIKTPELIIQNGVVFEGKCRITNDQSASAKELISGLYDK